MTDDDLPEGTYCFDGRSERRARMIDPDVDPLQTGTLGQIEAFEDRIDRERP